MSAERSIAIFDFDGTITSKDSYLEFIKYVKGSNRFWLGMFVLSPLIVLFYLKIIPNYRLKEYVFSHFFKGMNEAELLAKGKEFASEIVPKICFDAAIQRIQWHQSENHRVIILTASSSIWLKAWCDAMNLELIGTVFEVSNNIYTGKIKGKNCYGEEKRRIVAELLSSENYHTSYGYGDSKGDLPFLELTQTSRFGALS